MLHTTSEMSHFPDSCAFKKVNGIVLMQISSTLNWTIIPKDYGGIILIGERIDQTDYIWTSSRHDVLFSQIAWAACEWSRAGVDKRFSSGATLTFKI